MEFEQLDKMIKGLRTLGDFRPIAKSLGPEATEIIERKIRNSEDGENTVPPFPNHRVLIPLLLATGPKKRKT